MYNSSEIIKLSPSLKYYLWGGKALEEKYGFLTKYSDGESDICAEAWVLSSHTDGPSFTEDGTKFSEYISNNSNVCGTNCDRFEDFPVLIKFISSAKPLSVQVHPGDEYALKNEHQFGKTEMWYIIDCEENSFIYYGFNRDVSREEFLSSLEKGTVCDLLNKVYVKKGDYFFIEPGTVHAIGSGILIAEIQQNSNLTYRVYDYDRCEADGSKRELHIDKALSVIDFSRMKSRGQDDSDLLTECEYFSVVKGEGESELTVDDTSFGSIIITVGSGFVGGVEVVAGDSLFIPAGFGKVEIKGNLEYLFTYI